MRTILAIAAFALAGAAHAETCTFDTECFDGDGCAETEFEATLGNDGDGNSVLSTISEDVTGETVTGEGGEHSVFTGIGPGAMHLLTRTADGTARYTVHLLEGPMAITYLGACKADEG